MALHSHNNLPKDMHTIKRTSKKIFRSTNVKHVLNDKNLMTCTYNIDKNIFLLQHTK